MQCRVLGLIIPLMLACASCARPWNAAHKSLEIVAHGLNVVDRLAVREIEASQDPARERERIVTEVLRDSAAYDQCLMEMRHDCEAPETLDVYIDRYDRAIANWITLSVIIARGRDVLMSAEDVIEQWRNTKTRPEAWAQMCIDIDVLVEDIMTMLEELDVTIPSQVTTAQSSIGLVCQVVGSLPLEGGE